MWKNTDHAQVARNSFRKVHGCILPSAVKPKICILTVTSMVPQLCWEGSPTAGFDLQALDGHMSVQTSGSGSEFSTFKQEMFC